MRLFHLVSLKRNVANHLRKLSSCKTGFISLFDLNVYNLKVHRTRANFPRKRDYDNPKKLIY